MVGQFVIKSQAIHHKASLLPLVIFKQHPLRLFFNNGLLATSPLLAAKADTQPLEASNFQAILHDSAVSSNMTISGMISLHVEDSYAPELTTSKSDRPLKQNLIAHAINCPIRTMQCKDLMQILSILLAW
jgi:hypothetical protein